jgi:sugar/nucleoside kinase (ribokinase family)
MAANQETFWGPQPDTSTWTENEYLARFMAHATYRNMNNEDCVFFRKSITKENAEIMIWAVLKWVQHFTLTISDRQNQWW